MECWESIRYRRGSPVWEKDDRGIWIQSERYPRSDVIWSRNFDGDSYTFTNIDAEGDEYIDDHDGCFMQRPPVHKRNNDIFKTRCKYLNDTKKGKHSYEKLGYYTYNNDESKAEFLEEIEQKGLARKAESKKSTVEIEAFDTSSIALTAKELADYSNRYQEDEL